MGYPVMFLVRNVVTGDTEAKFTTLEEARAYGDVQVHNYYDGLRANCELAIVQAQLIEFVEKKK